MFRSESQKRRQANLALGNLSHQAWITQKWSTPVFLNNNDKDNERMVLEAHKLLLQFGLVVLPIDTGATEFEREVEATKDRVIGIHEGTQTRKANETVTPVFEGFIYTDEGVETVSKNEDRFQAVIKNVSVDQVDQVYRTSCQVIEKFTTCMDLVLGVDVFKHSGKFEYTRLVSKGLSSFQPFHCDYATNSVNGWSEYMGAFNDTLMTPLSSLYFPEGGQLGYRNYQPRTSIQYYIDKFEAGLNTELNNSRYKETSVEYQLHNQPTLFKPRKLTNVTQLLKIDPGHMAIFGQHAIHQGAGYVDRNLRYFRYLDFKKLKRAPDSTTDVFLQNQMLLDIKEKKVEEIVPHVKAGDQNIKRRKL